MRTSKQLQCSWTSTRPLTMCGTAAFCTSSDRYGDFKTALQWIADYLADRSLSVRIGNSTSDKYPLLAGVPQGSHLGPVPVFSVIINDLPSSTNSPTELYADNALIPSTIACMARLQDSLHASTTWARTWRGKFSPAAKTVLLCIGKNNNEAFQIDLDGQSLEQALHHKHLGFIFSSSLSWTRHIQQVITTAKRKTGLLRYMIPNLSPEVANKVYLTWVRPSMEYACPVWSASISAEESMALERVQASVARRILSAEWTTPKSELLRRLEWSTLWW